MRKSFAILVVCVAAAAPAAAHAQSVTPHHSCPQAEWDNLAATLAKADRVVFVRGTSAPARHVPARQTFEVLSVLKGGAGDSITIASPDVCARKPRAGAVGVVAFIGNGYLFVPRMHESFWEKLVRTGAASKAGIDAVIERVVRENWPTYRRLKVQFADRAGETISVGKAKVKLVKRSRRGLAICSVKRFGNIQIVRGNVRTEETRLGFAQFVEYQRITRAGVERIKSGRRSKVPRRRSPRCGR